MLKRMHRELMKRKVRGLLTKIVDFGSEVQSCVLVFCLRAFGVLLILVPVCRFWYPIKLPSIALVEAV